MHTDRLIGTADAEKVHAHATIQDAQCTDRPRSGLWIDTDTYEDITTSKAIQFD